ncbi:MAG: YhbY family RNA-binding protein [Limisphaerales bacterium]
MQPLSGSEKRALKSRAQRLEASLKLGRQGMSPAFCQQLNQALEHQQLVKVRFVEFKDQKKTMAKELAEKTACHLVTMVGHVAVFYRPENESSASNQSAVDPDSASTRSEAGWSSSRDGIDA